MFFDRQTFRAIQRAERVQREIIRELFVQVHGLKALRRVTRPARMRVFIVPRGTRVFAAISVWVSPSKKAISSAAGRGADMPPSAPPLVSSARLDSALPAWSGS